MNLSAEPVRIEVVAPNTSAARQVLRTYVDDVASSYDGCVDVVLELRHAGWDVVPDSMPAWREAIRRVLNG